MGKVSGVPRMLPHHAAMTIEPCSAVQRAAKVIRTAAAAGRNSDKKSMLDAAPSSSIPDGCRTEKEESHSSD